MAARLPVLGTGPGHSARAALRMELQEQIIARQKRLLSDLERDNCALRAAHALVLEEYLKLHATSMALHRLVTQTVQNAAISHETDVLRPNHPRPPNDAGSAVSVGHNERGTHRKRGNICNYQ